MNVTVTNKNESVIYNGKIYSHGDSFDVDDLIGKSLAERGYVSCTEQMEETDALAEMTYAELKKLAAEMGVSASGKKEDLIARIRAAEEAAPEAADDLDDAAPEADNEEAGDLPNTSMPE